MVVFDALPEACLAYIQSFTTPLDICRSSAVSRAFRAAAGSDVAWRAFLPPELDDIMSRVTSSPLLPPSSSPKRDVYFSLCDNPVLIDEGITSFSLHRWTGKRCFMLGARSLFIVWGDTPRYWRWSTFHGSRFSEVAELREVSWLEINAKIETRVLSPNTDYGAYFVFKFMEGTQGFENLPMEASVSTPRGIKKIVIHLDPYGNLRKQCEIRREHVGHIFAGIESGRISRANLWTGWGRQLPQERKDGWSEVELGWFFTGEDEGGEVQMSLMEVSKKKSGLIIQGIEIRPRHRR
ncbi:hypothetical protein SAY87_015353 [Trapa incisa]|uniref:F-box domain-containing protein n=2 Tax=Trapa TaxID=22665 RepID=A0AAN7MM95_TRANT|nr:hypothetical protein SAY87_015353 [Trapa incisa]KAK4801817.1 hypothetical protein SAY86_000020 [Trapa natans]